MSENGFCPVHMPEPAALRAESPQPDAWNEALWRKAAWNRITWQCDRTDFLAWRLREGGEGIEVLAYNYATLQIPSGHGLFYILDAPSLEAIGGPEPAAPPRRVAGCGGGNDPRSRRRTQRQSYLQSGHDRRRSRRKRGA